MPNGQDDLIIPDSVKKRAETADETLYGLKIPESVRGRVAEAANKPKPPVEEKKPGLIKRGLAAVGSVLTNPSYAAAADGQRLADAKPDGQRLVSTKPDAKPDEPSAPTDWRGVDEVDAGGGTTPVFQSGQNPTAAPARGSVLDRPAVAAPPDRMPEEGMLTPEFVRGIRSEFGKIQPEKRFDELRKMASGNGVKAMAARIILRDAEAENMRADFARQERPGMVDGLERAMAAPRIPIKATPGNPPESTVNFPETGALTQWIQQRDAAGVASRHGAARAVADDQRSIDALTQREQAAASDPDAKAFASENPMTSAVASGAANMLRGLDNIVPTVLDFASNLVGAKTSGVKNQSETSAWLERKAQNLMPESGQQEMGAAWHKGEFGEWLMLNLAATAPQLAPTLVAAFVPGTQGAALGLLGGIAAGNKYADTGNSAAAVASGMVEGFSERLPLKYFERSAKALSTLPPAIRGKTVQAIGKALPIVGKHLTAQAVVGTIEEVVAQIGNNGIDATILEKDNTLLDGVAEAAVIGAFASGGLSLPQGAGAIRRAAQSPEQHISQAIDQAAAQFGLNTKAAATLREKTAGMEPEKAASYAEKLFAAAERAGLVKKPGGGSAVRQNAKDLAAKAAKDAEAQQGDASGDSVPAGAAASSDTGLADDMDAGAILGTQAEAPQAASGEAPTEGATDGPMTDEPAQPGVEAGAAPPIEGDLTTGDGQPYGTKASARARATRDGGDVVEVLGGWVVRQSQPSNTRGTNAGDINAVSGTGSGPRPGAGGNAQPGSADTSGSGGTVDLVQGEQQQPAPAGVAGGAVPGADAGNRPAATGPGAGNEALTALQVTFGGKTYPVESVEDAQRKWEAFRDSADGGGAAGVSQIGNGIRVVDGAGRFVARISYNGRVWDTEDDGPSAGSLTAGQSVTVDGTPYTVKSAKPKVLVLTGADGKPRTITSDSATWAKVKPAEPNSVSDKPNSGTGPRILGKIGRTPNAAETVELRPNKDGTLTPHQGKYAMVDYETGEPVVIPGDSTNEQAIDAIKKSGAMGAKDKWFGVQKEQPDVVQGRAPVAQAQPDQKGTPAGGVEPAGAAAAPAVPAAGSAPVEADGMKPTLTMKPNGDGQYMLTAKDATGKRLGQAGFTVKEIGGKRYLSIDDISVKEQGRGVGSAMYEYAINNLPPGIDGVLSESGWRKNKQQVPAIHKKLAAKFNAVEIAEGTVFSPRAATPAAPAVVPGAGPAPVQAAGVKPRKTLQEARADAALDKQVRENGEVLTRRQWVERKVAEGLKTKVTQEDRIKPMSRMAYFRANNEEQRAHDRRVKEAGKKDVFWIGDYEVTKTEHDYANALASPPNAEAPVQAAPRGAEAAPAVSAPSELPRLPVESYRVERRYANGAVIRPLPGKAFTDGEVQQIAGWFRAAKWEVSTAAPSGVSAVNNANMSADDIPEPYTAAQRKKDERRRDADAATAAKTAAQDDYLTGTAAGEYVAATFGDTLNKFNSVALAKFLAGEASTFEGLMNARAADVVQGMGIAVEGRATKDVLADLKARFAGQSAPAPQPPSAEASPAAKYRVAAMVVGGKRDGQIIAKPEARIHAQLGLKADDYPGMQEFDLGFVDAAGKFYTRTALGMDASQYNAAVARGESPEPDEAQATYSPAALRAKQKREAPTTPGPTTKAQAVKEALAAKKGAQPEPAATHKDPGEPAEPVTPAVVREAIKTAADNRDRPIKDVKADALRLIDEAMPNAKPADDMDVQMYEATAPGVKMTAAQQAEYKRLSGNARDKYMERLANELAAQHQRAADNIGYVTIKVPGDGVFKVLNTVARLAEFRKKVESSPGFKDRQAPAGLNERATDALDRRSTDAAIANMVDEGDFQAALDFAEAKGVDIGAVKLTKLLRDRLEKWQKDQASAKAVADYEAARAEGKPAPGSLAAAFAEKEAAADDFALGQEPPKPVDKKVAAKDLAGQKDIFGGATPFADPLTLTERQLNSLRGKPITMKAQTEDGQVASWEIDAAEAVQSLRSREATIQQLVRCLS